MMQTNPRGRGLPLWVALIAAAVGGMSQAEAQQSEDLWLRGAGASFPAPLYQNWIDAYLAEHPDLTITYDSVGSGEGTSRFLTGSVDFGASDAALTDEQIAQVDRGVHLVPATAGMVVLAYNLDGVESGLKLKRDVYADIFRGEITRWDDPRIAAANSDLELPDLNITIVARQDGSGTTFALTNHLSAISDAWREGPGTGTLIDWPGSTMTARGNEGVSGRIKISLGSIGYVEYGFARRLGIPVAALENRAGQFVEPSPESGQLAIAEAESEAGGDDLRFFVPDPAGEGAYPIVTLSWLLLYGDYDDPKGQALADFVTWGLTEGQVQAAEQGYIPLAEEVAARGLEAVKSIQ